MIDFFCKKKSERSKVRSDDVVGVTGFEPAAPWSQTKCATKLRQTPKSLFFNNTAIFADCQGFLKAFTADTAVIAEGAGVKALLGVGVYRDCTAEYPDGGFTDFFSCIV